MKRCFIYSITLMVCGLWGSNSVLGQQPATPKASNTAPDRAPRDREDPMGFGPRDGRPGFPGEPGRPPRGPMNGRRGDSLRPDGPDLYAGPHNGDPFGGPGGPGRLEDLKKYDPEMYELEMKDREMEQQSFDLSQQYRRAPRDQREALKTQLQEVVQKHFEARQARRQLQLKRLEEELKQMREALERRTESRSQIVDRRIIELIGERSEFDF